MVAIETGVVLARGRGFPDASIPTCHVVLGFALLKCFSSWDSKYEIWELNSKGLHFIFLRPGDPKEGYFALFCRPVDARPI